MDLLGKDFLHHVVESIRPGVYRSYQQYDPSLILGKRTPRGPASFFLHIFCTVRYKLLYGAGNMIFEHVVCQGSQI